jgi:uncharacterized Zn finger protein (UPF0148 family)
MSNEQVKRCTTNVNTGFGRNSCSNLAKVERDGKMYCKIHDPEYIAAKNKERQERWEKERVERNEIAARKVEERAEQDRRLALFDEMLETMKVMLAVFPSVQQFERMGFAKELPASVINKARLVIAKAMEQP